MNLRFGLSLILLSFFFLAYAVVAESGKVYQYTDQDGKVHFTSKPPYQGAKPAKLPELTRGVPNTTTKLLATCFKHGGINCQAGADTDGSVICFDGFTEASARFRFQCSTAKLEIAKIGELQPGGALTVSVRNRLSMAAKNPELVVVTKEGKEINLKGPDQIDPFGVGEFSLEPNELGVLKKKPLKQELRLSCLNCS